jgi:putative sigma-54 modulation protein
MQFSFTFRQYEPSDGLRELIQSKAEKRLEKLVHTETAECRVTISTEKAWIHIEAIVTSWGETFVSAEKTTDLYPTIDTVIDKLERQLQRRKEMVHDRRVRRPGADGV